VGKGSRASSPSDRSRPRTRTLGKCHSRAGGVDNPAVLDRRWPTPSLSRYTALNARQTITTFTIVSARIAAVMMVIQSVTALEFRVGRIAVVETNEVKVRQPLELVI